MRAVSSLPCDVDTCRSTSLGMTFATMRVWLAMCSAAVLQQLQSSSRETPTFHCTVHVCLQNKTRCCNSSEAAPHGCSTGGYALATAPPSVETTATAGSGHGTGPCTATPRTYIHSPSIGVLPCRGLDARTPFRWGAGRGSPALLSQLHQRLHFSAGEPLCGYRIRFKAR